MNPFYIEAQVGALKRCLDEVRSDPKVWGEKPDIDQALHRLACLEEQAQMLINAIVDGCESERKEHEQVCAEVSGWKSEIV
jgi:hypothetical protein